MKAKFLLISVLIICVVGVLIGPVSVRPAQAQTTYTISSGVDNNPAGGCDFRQAVATITDGFQDPGSGCATPTGNDIIDLNGQTVTLALGGSLDIGANASGDTIENLSANPAVVDAAGNGGNPTFTVEAATFTFKNFTVQNAVGGGAVVLQSGALTTNFNTVTFKNNSSGSGGGAISGTDGVALNILASTFEDNSTTGTADGGAINTSSAVTNITGSFFGLGVALTGNTAAGSGGAIALGSGTMNISGTSFLLNTANATGNFGGGAIYNSAGTLNIGGSSFGVTPTVFCPAIGPFGNTAVNGKGGAIFVNPGASASIQDSVIIGNIGQSDGGAIYTQGALDLTRSSILWNESPTGIEGIADASLNPDVTVSNTTLAEQTSCDSGSGAIGVEASGTLALINDTIVNNNDVGVLRTAGTVNVSNTIVDLNNAGGGVANNCSGTITSQNYNIEGTPASCAFTLTFDQQGVTAAALNLSSLGPIRGSVLQLGYTPQNPSAAIDKANETVCDAAPVSDFDQNVIPPNQRPKDGDGNGSAICDVGSVEAPAVATATPTNTATNTATNTNTPTNTGTATNTSTNTGTATNTSTNTPTNTGTSTNTATATATNTGTLTATHTGTATNTATNTSTATATNTGTLTATNTGTLTTTAPSTVTATNTGTLTATNTGTLSATPTASRSPTATITGTRSVTPQPTSIPATSTPVIVLADPVIAKSVNPVLLRPGDTATFTLTVTNIGTAPALNVVVSDPISALLQVISTTETQGTATINGNTVIFSVRTVNPGQVTTLTILTRANPNDTPPADIGNVATLTFSGGSRSASASARLTAGALPGTGEHPDMPQPIWPAALLLGLMALGAFGAYQRTRRSVKR